MDIEVGRVLAAAGERLRRASKASRAAKVSGVAGATKVSGALTHGA
jgi:hypothetical protein